jgi:hypothetical protein
MPLTSTHAHNCLVTDRATFCSYWRIETRHTSDLKWVSYVSAATCDPIQGGLESSPGERRVLFCILGFTLVVMVLGFASGMDSLFHKWDTLGEFLAAFELSSLYLLIWNLHIMRNFFLFHIRCLHDHRVSIVFQKVACSFQTTWYKGYSTLIVRQ